MEKQKNKFYELNVKRTTNLCCGGDCFNNYMNENDSFFCGGCQIEKHVDHFQYSVCGYLCESCEKLDNKIKSMTLTEFKNDSEKFIKGGETFINSFN